MIVIRLVCHNDPLSWAILQNIGGLYPHGEAVMKGGTVIGAFAEGGVQERPLDYDGGNFAREMILQLTADDDMSAKFEHYLRSPDVMHEPYDYPGIANFMHFGIDLHDEHHVFCTALIHDDLRYIGWFHRPLPIPGHYVNPLILHQELLAQPEDRVRVITRDDPIFKAHIAGT